MLPFAVAGALACRVEGNMVFSFQNNNKLLPIHTLMFNYTTRILSGAVVGGSGGGGGGGGVAAAAVAGVASTHNWTDCECVCPHRFELVSWGLATAPSSASPCHSTK